ncbi:MAG: aminoglycoside phosphotransferase family protein [Jatrophihabitantaceae bacterium]
MVMHDDEIDISDELVRRLIEREVPELYGRPLRRLAASGSSNALFRLGNDHLVRLPRQPGGGASIETEARWLPTLASAVPVSVPEVLTVGRPGFGYPERWAVARWINGTRPVTPQAPGPMADALARDLASFAKALHAVEVPAQALADPALRSYRTGPLSDIDTEIRHYLEACRSLADLPLDLDACLEVWTEAVALPAPRDNSDRWVHSDLLAENLLLWDDRLAAVLDFGALSVGDPCVDLVVAWEVLGPDARQVFRSTLGVDDITWQRGRGWALAIAIMTFPYYWNSMPVRCIARLAMANEVLNDNGHSGRLDTHWPYR